MFKNIVHKIFYEKSDKVHMQFIRYLFTSGIALVADYALTFFLTEFCKVYYLVSSMSGNILGLIINYLLSIAWVFNNRKVKDQRMEFFIFILTSIVGMIITQSLVWLLTEIFKFHYMISKSFSILFGYLVRFFLRKKLLF